MSAKERFFEMSLCGWIYAAYTEARAQRLNQGHEATSTTSSLARTLARVWPLPAGILVGRGPAPTSAVFSLFVERGLKP